MDEFLLLGKECAARIGDYTVIMLDLTMGGVLTDTTFTWGAGALAAYPARLDADYLVLIEPGVTGTFFVPVAARIAASFDITHPNLSVDVIQVMIISRRP